jgi:sarcosine oxidase subunit alpha
LPAGGEIDRSRPIGFSFDGISYRGFAGDTLASALLGSGVRIVGRSFKYHRPRGIFGSGAEEPNAILDLRDGARHDPNARATLELLADRMQLRSTHARGTAANDRLAFVDRFARFIPAAFYYKTFIWPGWDRYEDSIRAMAGFGRLDPAARARSGAHRHENVDLCVIGGGAAGLAAALAGLRSGRQVLLIEEQDRLGGMLLRRAAEIEGMPGDQWVVAVERQLIRGGVRILRRATAFGLYDNNAIAVVEKGVAESENGERIWQIRARQIVIATGAIERPLLFGDNDRPGVMLADAALTYLRRHAVRAGSKVIVATDNDSAYEPAMALREAGADVCILDARPAPSVFSQAAANAGVVVRSGAVVEAALGRTLVEGALLGNGERIDADLIAVSGGWTPSLHLYCHAKGKPHWDPEIGAFRPGVKLPGIDVVGAANGVWKLDTALQEAAAAAGGRGEALRGEAPPMLWSGVPRAPISSRRRIWVDLQNDVTVKDIDLAVRENFAAVEHLKRYTTLGMATDQGKTSNVNGLAVLAARTGREISGTTTFRPPFVPVSMATIAGVERGQLQVPIRRLPAENAHRADGACFRDYGTLRPAWYGEGANVIAEECRAARNAVVALDASSLGKIEVIGPQAAALLDSVYYTPMASLKPGRLRYGLSLHETGLIADDGVVLRLASEHFVVSCSSGHVAAMCAELEAWRQDRFDLGRVFIHDATPHWATIAVSGPKSRAVVQALDLGIDLGDSALPHMAATQGHFHERPARVARVSFTGERSYEISVPAGLASELWRQVRAAGAKPLGIEALNILRAEKGYIYVGQDTDGETMPHDLGMGGPREKRQDAYVGDRALFTPAAKASGRKQLVGIAAEGAEPLPPGAHGVERAGGRSRSLGYVTSSYFSPNLDRPIALGLIENGLSRLGARMEFEHLGKRFHGRLVKPCFYDPEGMRLHG